jgi:Mce-associated membrane protein
MNGNNRPSQPYRLRIIVHEDDDGQMTAYDLHYPNGGN